MNVKEYIESVENKSDVEEYYYRFYDEMRRKNEELSFLITEVSIEDALKLINIDSELKGLPISVKDCFCTRGIRTTAGSKMLDNYIPFFDATVVRRIKEAGGVIVGKTAMDEFGFGTFSTNCYQLTPKNANDRNRVAGGSSGGAGSMAKSVSLPHIAIAESTGGSISCPASYNGVFGLTPTYGLLSRYGVIDYANSLDKPGIIAKDVFSIALALEIMAGKDERDQTTVEKPYSFIEEYNREIDFNNLNIGVITTYFSYAEDKVKKCVWKGVDKLREEGANVEEIDVKMTPYALAAYYIIATAEASTNLAKLSGMRYGLEGDVKGKHFDEYFSEIRSEGFGEEAKRRILLGTFARMSGYRDALYLRAMKVRTLVINEFKRLFKKYDVLISPTMPNIAPTFEEVERMEPQEVYAMDVLTVAPNLAGIPMISIPVGTVADLPVGMHVFADHLNEKVLLKLARLFE